jgi:hypothetical protein
MQQRRPPTPRTQKITTTHKQTHKQTANLNLADDYDDKVVAPPRRQLQQYETISLNNSQKQKHKDWVHGNAKYICKNIMNTAGPGKDDPELTESTPAETKIVTIVLPSCIILKL